MTKIETPESLEEKGITKVIVTYLNNETGFKKWLTKSVFKKYMKNDFDIYSWCIFQVSIIEMESKGICTIEFVK